MGRSGGRRATDSFSRVVLRISSRCMDKGVNVQIIEESVHGLKITRERGRSGGVQRTREWYGICISGI